LTLGTAIAQVLTVVATPVLSRLFTPAEFGVFAVFLSVTTVIATFVTLRYEIMILIPKEDWEAECLVFLCLLTAVCLGSVIALTSWVLPNYFHDALGIGVISSWLPLVCLIGIVNGITTTSIGWLNRVKLYKEIAILRIAQSTLFASIAILLGIGDIEAGLLLAQASSALILALFVIRYLPALSLREIWPIVSVAKKYSRAPKYLLPTALIDVITMQLPVLLIGTWYGASEAGQFSLAWRVLILPTLLVGAAFGQVFFQRFSSTWPDSRAAWALLTGTWKALALIGVLPMLLFIFAGEELFSFVFGPDWAHSGKMAAILAPMLFASLLHSPTSTTSVVLGLQRQVLFLCLAVVIYRPLSLYIGWKLGDIYIGLVIFCLAEIIQIIIFQYLVYKKIWFTRRLELN
jgi:lipopolysaccharide exporter